MSEPISPSTHVPARHHKLGAAAALVFSVLIWGVTFVNTRALLKDFSAYEILFLRFLIAYIALLVATRFQWLRLKRKRDEFIFAGMGLFGAALYQFLENCAIHYTNASNVSILVSICPMGTALLTWVIHRTQALSRNFLLGFILAMAGVTLVSLDGVSTFEFNPLGDWLAIAAMISWSVYSMLITAINSRGYSQLIIIRRAFFWALVFMVPFLGSFNFSIQANSSRFAMPLNWLNLLFLGVAASSASFVTWNYACKKLGTVQTTVALYMIPVVTFAFAYAFLNESLTLKGLAGAILTLAGVALSEKRTA